MVFHPAKDHPMRALLILSLLLLSSCAHVPPEPDISGLWINQAIIDAAALGQPLNTQGSNLEWNIDTHAGKAQVSNGFEMGEELKGLLTELMSASQIKEARSLASECLKKTYKDC